MLTLSKINIKSWKKLTLKENDSKTLSNPKRKKGDRARARKIERFSGSESTLMAVIQRLEIYGLFTVVADAVFCASNTDSPPLDVMFSLREKKGNQPFCPKILSRYTADPKTSTFLSMSFGRNERMSES